MLSVLLNKSVSKAQLVRTLIAGATFSFQSRICELFDGVIALPARHSGATKSWSSQLARAPSVKRCIAEGPK
ncbi:hypothetical protein ACU8OR_30575 (plasmid) [Rhizobium leguminosarum]